VHRGAGRLGAPAVAHARLPPLCTVVGRRLVPQLLLSFFPMASRSTGTRSMAAAAVVRRNCPGAQPRRTGRRSRLHPREPHASTSPRQVSIVGARGGAASPPALPVSPFRLSTAQRRRSPSGPPLPVRAAAPHLLPLGLHHSAATQRALGRLGARAGRAIPGPPGTKQACGPRLGPLVQPVGCLSTARWDVEPG
jgi:hypothetical protein